MLPPKAAGTVKWIASEGDYKIGVSVYNVMGGLQALDSSPWYPSWFTYLKLLGYLDKHTPDMRFQYATQKIRMEGIQGS
jgi:hypothetical protein